MLTNSYLIALGIPLLLVVCGALAKKLVRGTGWRSSDFFLGVELALASIGSAMVYFFELQKQTAGQKVASAAIGNSVGTTASFVTITFFSSVDPLHSSGLGGSHSKPSRAVDMAGRSDERRWHYSVCRLHHVGEGSVG